MGESLVSAGPAKSVLKQDRGRLSLLMVARDYPPEVGGIQTYAAELARRFAASCANFAVLAPRTGDAGAVDDDSLFPVHRVASGTGGFPLAAAWSIPRLVREHRFSATFHTEWQSALGADRAVRAGRLTRYFVAAHGRELLLRPVARVPPAQWVYDRTRRRVLAGASGLFPVSRYTSGLLRAIDPDLRRIAIVSNGTDPQRFRPLDPTPLRRTLGLSDDPVLLTVGRLVPHKGIDTVLLALRQVRERVPNIRYLVVGEGADRPRLEQLVATYQLDSQVRFLGRVSSDELPQYFAACDLFVTPSRAEPPSVEGFGLVFLEANACGKPVIGTRCGGIPEAVVDGETGLLVDVDQPEQLADAITRLLLDRELARHLGTRGRQRVIEAFTWDRTHDQLYEALTRFSDGRQEA